MAKYNKQQSHHRAVRRSRISSLDHSRAFIRTKQRLLFHWEISFFSHHTLMHWCALVNRSKRATIPALKKGRFFAPQFCNWTCSAAYVVRIELLTSLNRHLETSAQPFSPLLLFWTADPECRTSQQWKIDWVLPWRSKLRENWGTQREEEFLGDEAAACSRRAAAAADRRRSGLCGLDRGLSVGG